MYGVREKAIESQLGSTHSGGLVPWSRSGEACADWCGRGRVGSLYTQSAMSSLAAAFIVLSTVPDFRGGLHHGQ